MEKELNGDFLVLREALDNQNKLVQQLCDELDEEREASSTAASEALSMILRLQAEKAAVDMEARHYRRMAEEKMHYAQESLAVFEQLMYKKEMEIKSLEFQVQALKHKLLSLGVDDFDVESIDELEDQLYVWRRQRENVSRSMWLKEEDDEEEEEEEDGGQRRRMTKIKRKGFLPPMKIRFSSYPSSHRQKQKHSSNAGSSKKIGPFHRWSTVKSMAIKDEEDDKIMEVRCEDEMEEDHKLRSDRGIVVFEESRLNFDANHVSFKSLSRSSSFHSAVCNDEDIECENHLELVKTGFSFTSCQSEDGLYLSEFDTSSCFPGLKNETVKKNNEQRGGVHDVFEVPKHLEGDTKKYGKVPAKNMDDEDRLKKPNLPMQHKSKEHLSHEEKASMISVSELCGTQALLGMMLKQLEDERERMKQDAQRNMEEFKLLKDMCELLDTIQFPINNKKSDKRNSRSDNSCIVSIIEAILHCSI